MCWLYYLANRLIRRWDRDLSLRHPRFYGRPRRRENGHRTPRLAHVCHRREPACATLLRRPAQRKILNLLYLLRLFFDKVALVPGDIDGTGHGLSV